MVDQASPGSILIVDDSENMLRVIESALEDAPLIFRSTTQGREALALLDKGDFDLVLLDAKMPDLNGFEVCRLIKQNPRHRNTKVIMVSASSSTDDKLGAFEVGADDYITKPFRPRELQARVRVMINLSHAEKQLLTRNNQLLELIHFSELINFCLDVRSTSEEVVRSAASLTKADYVYLYEWEADKRRYKILSHQTPHHKALLEETLTAGESLLAVVQEQGHLLVIPDYNQLPQRAPQIPPNTIFELAAMPLRLGSRHVGILVVAMSEARRHFSQHDLDILTSLANQAAIALENSRLYTEVYRSEEQYRLIAEKASDLIVSLRPDGTVAYVNERLRSLLDHEPLETIGRDFRQLLVEDSQLLFSNILERLSLLEPKQMLNPDPYELTAFTREGRTINLEFNFGVLFGTGGVSGFQAIGRDVSARRRAEEQERMRVLGTLASGVAHDFNNVLANVLGHAQLLEQETTDEETRHTLQIIEQAALDGAETVRRIQEFTGQRTTQKLDLIDVNKAIESTIELSRPRWRDDAQAKGMHVEIERELQPVLPVHGKAAELREVLVNLLNNAIDAFPPAGGKLFFRSHQDGEKVVVQVADNGVGMSPEVRRHIFEPFYTTKGVRGTGLGLSVVYGIISRYGGQIICDSTLGVGTTFTITLPVGQFRPEAKPNSNLARLAQSVTYKGRILIIDDEANIRSILSRALSQVGFEVQTASSGSEGLDLLARGIVEAHPFQLVLSDLGMPNMSGWEVASAVAQRWSNLPLVLVTGWGDQLDPEKMRQHQVQHTLAKPFNLQDVISLAASLVPQ